MIVTRTKVNGLKELEKALDNLTEPNFRRLALMRSGKVAMQQILADAIMNAPTLSSGNVPKNPNISGGELKSDISYRGTYNMQPRRNRKGEVKGGLNKYEYVGQVKTGPKSQDYAIPLEYGRAEFTVMRIKVFGNIVDPYEAQMVEMKPNPFMRKALDSNAASSITKFKTELAIQVMNMAKKQKVPKK